MQARNTIILFLIVLFYFSGAAAQSRHSPSSLFSSYKGLVMAGYQGWFNAPDDGGDRGWNHFASHGKFGPGNVKVDLWPDVSEYKKTYPTSFMQSDGSPAYLFSSHDASTTDLHFKWMKEYGIDGVFVQRFVSNVKSPVSLRHNNTVLANALDASVKYRRAIGVMYDFSGMKEEDSSTVINDWKQLVDSLKITGRGDRQTYLYHNGKPLVTLWGVGFPGRLYGLKAVEKIIDFLKNDPRYGGCSVMLGVPTYWRDLDKDTDKDPYLHEILKKADIVQPWFVGRYQEATYPEFKERIRADIEWCRQNKLDYVPVVFPGFSWHNMYPKSPMDQIPRNRGSFYWKQIVGALQSGAEMLYIAMFDEIDEGTAIFKASKNPPVGESNFVKFESDIPSDYYLYLTGHAGKMLRKEIPLQEKIPQPASSQRADGTASGPTPLTSFVNPYIGSGGHGHVFVGASVPFGAIQPGPQNIFKGWDWDSGYNFGDSILIGFSHTHLNGTGIGDLGDLLIMPYTGAIKTDKGTEKDHQSGYSSLYTHRSERISPGYYSVVLDDYHIGVELTATERVGFHRYHFPAGKDAHVIVDLKEGTQDQSYDTYIEQTDAYTFKGYRFSKGWAKDQRLWFAIRSSEPVQDFKVYDGDRSLDGNNGQGKAIKGLISFDNAPSTLQLKVSISPVSADNALDNILAETPDWDFEKLKVAADGKWNRELAKITVETGNATDKRIFYTALYHTMIDPSIYDDHKKKDPFTNYTIFSLWDTYRAVHPLYTIMHPDRVNDMVKTMLAIYGRQGKLPIWHLMGNETGTMVGISSIQVIAEAYLKGIRSYDTEKAYAAIKATANADSLGLMYVKNLKYIPSDRQSRAVAKALEYAISDASIALMAKQMGKMGDYKYFSERAKNYKLYFDPATKFFRGRISDGSWRQPFDPIKSYRPWAVDYAEGNAWQYLWLVPEDAKGLQDLLGGEKTFTDRLDTFFSTKYPPDSNGLADLTGLIGQYAHGNEPGHHIAYLYAYAGRQWKTAEKARYIVKEFYRDEPDGTIGNEDCGQMSAWYVFSSLGFYPVFPASGEYVIGSPLFDKASIQVPGDKKFVVQTVGGGPDNIYVQSMTLNGKPYKKAFISHRDIMQGGNLTVVMGPRPNMDFGAAQTDRP